MVTENGIHAYVCSEKEVHSVGTTKEQCTRVAISWIMEWLRGPRARMPWPRFPGKKG